MWLLATLPVCSPWSYNVRSPRARSLWSLSRGWLRRRRSEIDLWRFAVRRVRHLVILPRLRTGDLRGQRLWELADVRVVLVHGVVVIGSRYGDAILSACE